MKSMVTGKNKYILGITAAVFMFAAIGFISLRIMNNDIEAGNESARSYEIINTANNIQTRLKDLGLMRRGLMLTGDNSMLDQYPATDGDIKLSLARLIELTSYDPDYVKEVRNASRMTFQRLENLRNSLYLFRVLNSYDQFQYTYTVISKPLVKLNNSIYEDIKAREEKNVRMNSEVQNESMLLIKYLLIVGNLTALMLLVYSILRLRKYNKLILNEIELRKVKESELIDIQLEIEKLSNLSPVGIFHLDSNLNLVYANSTMSLMTGYGAEELLSFNICSMITDEDKQRFLIEWNSPLKDNRNFKGEFRLLQKSGKVIYVICEFARQQSSSGKITKYICSLTDITKLHEYQEELVKYNSLFEGITEGISDPIMVKDSNGAYEYVNTAAADFIGMEREDIIGKTDSVLHAPEIAAEISEKEKSVLNYGKSINYELSAVHPDGTLKTFLTTKGVLRNSKNKAVGLFSIARDVTQLKKKEEEISKSLKEKETLLKEIHHRVKNNLQIVVSLLRLQSGYVKDQESKKYFLDSQNRIRSMAVVHEKLYSSKNLADIDLKLYLEQLVSDLVSSLSIDTSKIKITAEIESLSIDLDHAIPVGLIVNEILTNSFKYAFPNSGGGEIYIKAAWGEGGVNLTLSDNGIGLPANKNIKDFDSLGLQLVQTLTEGQLSGKLILRNDCKGTNFDISFPYNTVAV